MELNANAGRVRQRWVLEMREGGMCYSSMEKNSKEPEWINCCNFELLRIVGVYQFIEDDGGGDPYWKALCRLTLDEGGEGDIYLAADDMLREPVLEGARSLLVEVS